jgi:hypothetical protein
MELSVSKESKTRTLGPSRCLKQPEKSLMRQLIQLSGNKERFLASIDTMEVQEMADGGMGSLYITSPTKDATLRQFGRQIAEPQFKDADDVLIVSSLNVDKDGDLFELDIWKTDFKPVIQLNPQS